MDKVLTFFGEKIIPIFHVPKLLRKISSLEMELAEKESANARLQMIDGKQYQPSVTPRA